MLVKLKKADLISMPGVVPKNYMENRKFLIDNPFTQVLGIEHLCRIESDPCSNRSKLLRVHQCKNGMELLEFRPRESLLV